MNIERLRLSVPGRPDSWRPKISYDNIENLF